MKDTQKLTLTHDEIIRLNRMLVKHRNFLGNTPMENRLEAKLAPFVLVAKENHKERLGSINEAMTQGAWV